jgi:membrane-associated phospholipid phosphatase
MEDTMVQKGPVRAPPWLLLGFPSVVLVLLILVVSARLDRTLFHFFNQLSVYTGPALWANLTILGDGLVCAVLLLPWIRKNPERVWGGLLGAVLMTILLRMLKEMIGLPRPPGVLPEDALIVIGPGYRRGAFPSGHTATIALYAGIWALSTSRRLHGTLALCLAVLVGVSRMAVGVHWPSDVLGGLILGWGSAWAGLSLAGRWSWGTGRRARNIQGGVLMVSAVVLLVIDHTGYPGVLLLQRTLALTCLIWGAVELRR